MTKKPDQSDQAGDFLKAYDYSAGLLRAWLGAYSVGVPAFLFTQESAWKKLVEQGAAPRVGAIFAVAIAFQVGITLINKYIQWGVYSRYSPPERLNWFTNFCDKASEWIWLDAIADLTTIGLLVWGSLTVFAVLMSK